MNVKVINIKPEHERILLFLYPTYSYSDSVRTVSKFITHKDVCSRVERDNLDFRYQDAVIISNRIFDEVWDEETIKNKVLEFSRVTFKSRKRTIEIDKDDYFVDNLIKFLFSQEDSSTEDSSIMNLFNTFGSKLFNKEFLTLAQYIPVSVLTASMNTFITKIIQEESSSIFYKKKSILFKDKIRSNFIKAYDSYSLRDKDSTGLSYVKFCNDLVI